MKKFLKLLPLILFAVSLIGLGAIGKLTGAAPAVEMFEQINLFGQGEAFGRILVGLGQLAAGIGVFFKPTRKIAAVLGLAIMAGAVAFHISVIGVAPIMYVAIATMALAIYIIFAGGSCGHKTCSTGTCSA